MAEGSSSGSGGGKGGGGSGSGPGLVQTSLALARVVLHSRQLRRQAMFYATIVAMFQLFAGMSFLDRFLMKTPLLFVAYWCACIVLVSSIFLLAFYDLLAVKRDARFRERELERELQRSIDAARSAAEEESSGDGDGDGDGEGRG